MTLFEEAAAHARTILARLAGGGTRGRYRIVFHADGETHTLDDTSMPPDVILAFDARDYLACVAGTRTLHQSAFEGRARMRGDRQLGLRFARAFADAVERPQEPHVTPAVARRPAQPRPSDALAARLPPVTEVVRIERPDVEWFRRELLATGTPAILTGALDDWELARWDRARLKSAHGDLLGVVRPGNVDSAAPPHVDASIRAFAQLIDELDAPEASRYLAYNELPQALAETIRHPPYFARDEYEDPPNLWLGPAGTVTQLHRDGTDNLFAQIWGRKRFVLHAPDQRPLLYAWAPPADTGLDGCDVDPERPDYERFPLFREARAIECVVEAGEMLFLPEGWFHHVRSLAPSLSVNFWTRTKR